MCHMITKTHTDLCFVAFACLPSVSEHKPCSEYAPIRQIQINRQMISASECPVHLELYPRVASALVHFRLLLKSRLIDTRG